MRMRLFRTRRRTGFTLVELMVAVTLIIFIMVILTEAFKAGIDAFRELKAAGDAAEKLRSAANVIRKDLASPHFESDGPDPTLREFVRDQRLDRPGWKPPERGFFRIWQGNEPSGNRVFVSENTDSEGLNFTRATKHILHFTSKYEGDEPGEYFGGLAPNNHTNQPRSATNLFMEDIANQDLSAFMTRAIESGNNYRYASRWGEVALFLVPNGSSTSDESGNTGQTLHSLHRRVRVIPRTPTNANPRFRVEPMATWTNVAEQTDVSLQPSALRNNSGGTAPNQHLFFNNLQMLTDPRLRMDADSNGGWQNTNGRPRTLGEVRPGTTTDGDDILLNDVISFEVKVWWRAHANNTTPALNIPHSTDTTYVPLVTPPNTMNYFDINNASADTDRPFRVLPDPAVFTNAYKNPHYAGQARVFDTGICDAFLQAELGALSPALRMNWDNAADTNPPNPPTEIGYLSNHLPYRNLNLQVPLRIHVKALQIKLRIWDVKTRTTRQVTIVQEI